MLGQGDYCIDHFVLSEDNPAFRPGTLSIRIAVFVVQLTLIECNSFQEFTQSVR